MVDWKKPLVVVDQWGPFKGQPPATKALQAETADGGTLLALCYGNGGGVPAFIPGADGQTREHMVHRREGDLPYQLFLAYFPPGRGPNTTPDPDADVPPTRYPYLEEILSAVHNAVPRGCLMAIAATISMGPDQSTELPDGAVGFVELRQTGKAGPGGPGIVKPDHSPLSVVRH